MNYQVVPESEEEILLYLWESGDGKTAKEILSHFNEAKKKNWKKQTLNTLLSRLNEKNFLSINIIENKRVYFPVEKKEVYEKEKAEHVIEKSFGGSLKRFLTALSGNTDLSEEDIQELKKMLEEYK